MENLVLTEAEAKKKARARQYVFEATWIVKVEGKAEPVVQLIVAKTFQSAFFKARAWATSNLLDTGSLISIVQKQGMVI
jgi:hypothetical protein